MKEALILAGVSLLTAAAYEGIKHVTGVSKKLTNRRASITLAETMRLAKASADAANAEGGAK